MEIILKDKYEISLETQKFILQMCMAQWDAQWFLKSIKKFGIDIANEMNQTVVSSFGKIEAKHILNALGIKKGTIKTIPEVFKIMNTIMDVIIPKIMKFKMVIHSDTEGDGIVKKCFVWEEVKKANNENNYVCACNFRHRGWMEAMGIDGEIIPMKRFPDGDDECIFKFIMDNSND
ncbi:MAG: hypothetical protein ACFFBP_15875 [Promethearchaeota archaeon]